MTTTGANQKILFTKTIKSDGYEDLKQDISDSIQVHAFTGSEKLRFPFVAQPLTKQERVEYDFQRFMQRPDKRIFIT